MRMFESHPDLTITTNDAARSQLDRAIAQSQAALLSLQDQEGGYFWAEIESNVSQTTESVMLSYYLGTPRAYAF